MCVLISSSCSWTRWTNGSLSINALGWEFVPVIVVDEDRAVGPGRVVGSFSSSSSSSLSLSELEDSACESESSSTSVSRCWTLCVCSDRVLTSGLLLTEIPESELKVSWRFQTSLFILLLSDGNNGFLFAVMEAIFDGGSSTSLLLADDEASDLGPEGGFDFPLIRLCSSWLPLSDNELRDEGKDEARDEAFEGGFEVSLSTASSSILPTGFSIRSIESLRRSFNALEETRCSDGSFSLVLLRCFRPRLLRKSVDRS